MSKKPDSDDIMQNLHDDGCRRCGRRGLVVRVVRASGEQASEQGDNRKVICTHKIAKL